MFYLFFILAKADQFWTSYVWTEMSYLDETEGVTIDESEYENVCASYDKGIGVVLVNNDGWPDDYTWLYKNIKDWVTRLEVSAEECVNKIYNPVCILQWEPTDSLEKSLTSHIWGDRIRNRNLAEGSWPKACTTNNDCVLEDESLAECEWAINADHYCAVDINADIFDEYWKEWEEG